MEDVVEDVPDIEKIKMNDENPESMRNKFFNKHKQQKIHKNDEKSDEEIAEEACSKFFTI